MLYRICIGGPDDGFIKVSGHDVPTKCVLIGTWKDDMKDKHPDGYYHYEAYEPLKKED